LRGGSFNNSDNNLRCANRNDNNPTNRNNNVGFRLVAHGILLISYGWSAPRFWVGYGLPSAV
jgi:hypothetical protein